jgi:hypothetical protein
MPSAVESVASAARSLAAAKEEKLKQLRLAKQSKQDAEEQATALASGARKQAGGGQSAASKALNIGKSGAPPTAPKPFYKKFTVYVQTTNGTVARYIGASAETTIGELKRWGYFNAFPDECKSIYKLGFAFDGVELAETMTLQQLGFTRGPEIRRRPIVMNPDRYPILQRNADDGLQVESDDDDEGDKVNLGKKKKSPAEMTDPERRVATLEFFAEKCKPSFPDTTEVSSEDLLALMGIKKGRRGEAGEGGGGADGGDSATAAGAGAGAGDDDGQGRSAKLMLVDCRSVPECLVSMLPGAVHQKEFQSVVVPVLLGQKKRPQDAPWKSPSVVVAYCGNSVRSGKLVMQLQKDLGKVQGLKLLNHLGCISDWCHVDGPLAEGKKQGKGGKVVRGTGAPTRKVHACTRRFVDNFPAGLGYEVVLE